MTARRGSDISTAAVVGMGYVGLPTAIALAEAGVTVIGCDTSEDRLSVIKTGRADLLDPDRQSLQRHLGSKSFVLTTNVAMTATAGAVIICVPTPVERHLVPDLGALSEACSSVVRHAVPGQTIVLTSTTYVGCTRQFLVEPLGARGLEVGTDVFVAFSPERIDPGNDHEVVPRVVGGATDACRHRAAQLLEMTTTNIHHVSSLEAAEATKLLENTFRAVNIAFVNEFADACDDMQLDVLEIIRAAATKPYGFMPFYPGPGVGGHCIPCDPHYLLWQLRERRAQLPLTEAAMTAIALRPRQVVARARGALAASGRAIAGARVLVVGVTYKPRVSDLRGSPALEIMAELIRHDACVDFTDPLVNAVTVNGRELLSVSVSDNCDWDLALVHTVDPATDYSWLSRFPTVLDTTFGAARAPARLVLR